MSLLIDNPEQKSSLLSGALLKRIFLLLLLIIIGVAAVLGYKELTKEPEGPSEEQMRLEALHSLYAEEALPSAPEGADPLNYGLEDTTTTADGIRGHIIFTGGRPNSDSHNQVYSLDVSAENPVARRLMPDFIQYSAFLEVADRVFPYEFFVDSLHYSFSQISEKKATESHSIQRYNFNDGSLKGFDSISGSYVQNIAWASGNTSRLAYSRAIERPNDYLDLVSIDNWEVVITDLSTDKVIKVLRGATQPKWSPDGSKLIVLRSDGIYVYEIETQSEMKIVESNEGKFIATSMLDVSPDGKYLVWTVAKAGVVVMNEIVSWSPFETKEVGRLHEDNTEYYWPQFSPDSRYYAVQAIDAAKPGSTTRDNPRLEIRATLGRDILKQHSMSDFDFNALFTDTWIEQVSSDVLD